MPKIRIHYEAKVYGSSEIEWSNEEWNADKSDKEGCLNVKHKKAEEYTSSIIEEILDELTKEEIEVMASKMIAIEHQILIKNNLIWHA